MSDSVKDIKTKAVVGTVLNFISNVLTKCGSMIVQLVLARLILPEEFGTIAILNVFISIANVFTTKGFASAIIQKNNVTEVDKSSAFYMSLGISLFLYVAIFVSSPYIAKFYDSADLENVLRVYAVVIIMGALMSVHNALLQKELKFNVNMWKGVIIVVVQGVVGILLAYKGYGVWALVISYIIGNAVSVAYIWFMIKWRPKLLFSWTAIKSMFKFSSNVLMSSLFNTVYSDIRALVIGKVYTTEQLAFYDRANLIRGYIFDTTIGAVSTVALPTLSKVNDSLENVKIGIRRIIKINMYISTPMRVGLILIAEPLILLLLTETWRESIPFLQLICITNILAPCMYRTNAYLAIGKSSIALRTELINKLSILICIFLTLKYNVYMVVISALFGNVLSFIEGLIVNKKYIGYTIKEQIADIIPPIILSIVMGIPIYLISLLNLPNILQLILQVGVGGISYALISIISKNECFYYLLSIFKDIVLGKLGKKKGV